jgi:uncharacterized membrane protein
VGALTKGQLQAASCARIWCVRPVWSSTCTGVIARGMLVVFQRTFGIVQGTFYIVQGTFVAVQGTFVIVHGTLVIVQGMLVIFQWELSGRP